MFSFVGCLGAACNFKCNDGECIPDNWVCDDEEDCPSGEDEEPGSCLGLLTVDIIKD